MASSSSMLLSMVLLVGAASAHELFSDVMVSSRDEARALEVKHEKFWKPVAESAVEAGDGAKARLAKIGDAQAVIDRLPKESKAVADLLSKAVAAVRRANGALERDVGPASDGALAELSSPADGGDSFSMTQLFSGVFNGIGYSGNVFGKAVQRFTGGGEYGEKLTKQVGHRQAAVLPMLRGAASATKGVLSDCRLAQSLAFDAQKYDVYNDGVAKTPKEADELAERIVAVASETRRSFTKLIRNFADSIGSDVSSKGQSAASIAVQDSIARGGTSMSSMGRGVETLISL